MKFFVILKVLCDSELSEACLGYSGLMTLETDLNLSLRIYGKNTLLTSLGVIISRAEPCGQTKYSAVRENSTVD